MKTTTLPEVLRSIALLTLANDRQPLGDLGDRIALERLGCPFLSFRLEVDLRDHAALFIAGSDGVMDFIEATFVRERIAP